MATEERECPLCMEPMESDDLAFYPCDCRYQVCRFCWAKIINEENGLCPACRKEYNSEKPALFKPLADQEDSKHRINRKRKEHMKKNRLNSDMLKLLPELRVVQPNLIFVVGLPAWVCKDKEALKGQEYFGRYGKVFKVEINQNQTFGGPQGQPSFSAYITFYRAEDAMRSIRELDQGMLHGRSLRVSLGTTKYCSQFLRGSKCTKHECMYLHELGDPAASFTKEEMQAGKHTEYMNKLLTDCSVPPDTATSCSQTASNNSNHISMTGNTIAANSLDEPRRSGTRDGPVSPRAVTTLVGVDLSSSPCSTSSTRQPDGNGSAVSASPLKYSPVAGQLHSGTINHRTSPPSDLNNSRKLSTFSGSYVYPQFDNAVSPNTNLDVKCTPLKDNCVPPLGSDDANRGLSWIPSQLILTSTSPDVSKTVVDPSNQISEMTSPYFNGIISDIPSDTEASKEHIHARLTNSRRGNNFRMVGSQRHPNAKVSVNSSVSSHMTNWYRSTQSTDGSSGRNRTSTGYGDEPVDLGFDPFRESQQGLAELLAAELGQLGLRDENSQPMACYDDSTAGSVSLRPRHVESADHSKPARLSWSQTEVTPSVDDESEKLEYPPSISKNRPLSLFTSRLYPPPGFERSAQSFSTPSTEVAGSNPVCLGSQVSKTVSPSGRLDFSSKNHPACQRSVPTDFCDAASNGSISVAPALFDSCISNPCLLDRQGSAIFPTFGFHHQDTHGRRHESVDISGKCVGVPLLNDPNITQHEQQQQQAMAHFFATAFNTASAMFSNNRQQQQSTGDKPSASSSSPLPFDVNAFFSQLFRQSPFLFSHSSSSSASPFLSNGFDWPPGTACGSSRNADDEHLANNNDSTSSTHTPAFSSGGASTGTLGDGCMAHTSSAGVVNALSSAAMAAAGVLFPSTLPFGPRLHNDYSSGPALLPPGLVRPAAVFSDQNAACSNFRKITMDNRHDCGTGSNLFTSPTSSSSIIPSSLSSAQSSVISEHLRPGAGSLTWQLDDPAIVSSQLSTDCPSSGWKLLGNKSGTGIDDPVPSTAAAQSFWQGDSAVHQLFDQHILQSPANYTSCPTTISRTSCQPQQIRTPASSTSLLVSSANTTESGE